MSSKSSTTDADSPETILVGLVHKPHGLRGEVAVESFSEVADRFAVGAGLDLVPPTRRRRRVRVRSCRRHSRGLLIGFEGVVDRDRAEELRGARLEVLRDEVPPAPEGEFYHFELVDCLCVDGSGRELGVVTEVVDDGGGQILRIVDGSGEILVPFVRAFLKRVDLAARLIELELPAGLLETCRSRS
jgi:16S rRNA processing protein RimM